jgi:hypothetical protein
MNQRWRQKMPGTPWGTGSLRQLRAVTMEERQSKSFPD